jgi:8-oxo-dGTP diphosphatase
MEHRDMTEAVGVWFYSTQTQRYLYLMRADSKHPHTWALPGGKILPGESLLGAIHRECSEELGYMPDYVSIMPIEKFSAADGRFVYHTFFCVTVTEFSPVLNHEHLGYAWIDTTTWPKPLHPGLWNTMHLQEIMDKISVIRQQI